MEVKGLRTISGTLGGKNLNAREQLNALISIISQTSKKEINPLHSSYMTGSGS